MIKVENKAQCHRSDAAAAVVVEDVGGGSEKKAQRVVEGKERPSHALCKCVCSLALHSSCQLTTFSRTILTRLIADYESYFCCCR